MIQAKCIIFSSVCTVVGLLSISNNVDAIFLRNKESKSIGSGLSNQITNVQQKSFPRQTGLLNDTENVFTDAQKKELDKILLDFNKSTGNKILIVSANSFEPDANYQVFAEALAVKWKIELNNKGKVILIAFSAVNRKITLTKAKGVTLSDGQCQKIISEKAIPALKKNDFYKGIKNAVLELSNKWQ